MRLEKYQSTKKTEQVEKVKQEPFEIGESVFYNGDYVTIKEINGDEITIEYDTGRRIKTIQVSTSEIKKDILSIGKDPFVSNYSKVRFVAFSFESILFQLNVLGDKDRNREFEIKGIPVQECNWNPYIYDKDGNKQYYQRDFVWSLKDKQNLVESIYNDVDCGKIIVRKRGWNELERLAENGATELAFRDIVDGKQRLKAIGDFIENKYKDLHGNYFGDLSFRAQNQFLENQLLSYGELPEDSKDEDVLRQFLKLNVSGVPQSEEHLAYVRSLYENTK